jgi:hypothetical protein
MGAPEVYIWRAAVRRQCERRSVHDGGHDEGETIMYILSDLAQVTHDDKLRAAAQHHLRGRAYAAHRAGNRGNPVPRLAILRGRRAAGAY